MSRIGAYKLAFLEELTFGGLVLGGGVLGMAPAGEAMALEKTVRCRQR